MKKKILLKLTITIIIITIIKGQITLPIEKKNPEQNILELLFSNEIVYKLNIGTPIQIIESKIDFSQPSFYISSDSKNKKFNYEKSSSYKNLNKPIDTKYLPFNNGVLSSESIKFVINDQETLIPDFSFFNANNQKENKNFYSSSIGFSISNDEKNLISFFKEKNYIKKKFFYVNYFEHFVNNKQIGEIKIGETNKSYKKIYSENKENNLEWNIKIDKVTFNKKNLEIDSFNVYFDINIFGMFGTEELQRQLNLNFFGQRIKNKTCIVDNFDSAKQYIYYYCEKDVDLENFHDIIFYNKNQQFKFSYKDLFIKINDKYYFSIVYDNSNNKKFIFGEVFLKKYPMLFNLEDNSINFITSSSFSFWNVFNIILIVILSILIVYVFLRITIRILSRRVKSKQLKGINDFFINLDVAYDANNNKITI